MVSAASLVKISRVFAPTAGRWVREVRPRGRRSSSAYAGVFGVGACH